MAGIISTIASRDDETIFVTVSALAHDARMSTAQHLSALRMRTRRVLRRHDGRDVLCRRRRQFSFPFR
jgi:hypothetical protein